jgi:16S rRNA processing protein RimM
LRHPGQPMRKLDKWIEAGAVMRPHGIRGEVAVDLKQDLLACIAEKSEIRVSSRDGAERHLRVERVREHKGRLIIKFEGVDTREGAEQLRAFTIWLTREQIGPLEGDRWFVQDVLGMDVDTDEGEHLGKVAEVMHMPANDVFVVRGEGGEILLPVIADVIVDVDVEAGKMLVHLMEGLR